MYVGPQIGMNPKPILGLPDLIWGFFGVFLSHTRSAFSHQKLRQSGLRCAAAATTAAATTAATVAATAGRQASSAATASNLLSCRLLFSPRPPPSRLLVSSVVAPDPDDDDDDNDNTVSTASTATTTVACVCRLRDWASHCPSIILPSSSSLLMSLCQLSPACECRHIGVVVIVDVPRRSAHIPVAQSWQERLSSS